MKLDSETVLYGVFGDPVRHSKSPLMQNAAFRAAGINAAYAAFRVTAADLGHAVAGIRSLGFGGINVTIPHKVAIMDHLDDIDEDSRLIGAVNTVVNRDGRLIGYNTDGIGYVRSLKEETGLSVRGRRVLLLGAGGAAQGVAFALAREWPEQMTIANRTVGKAEALADAVRRAAPGGADCRAVPLGDLAVCGERYDLIINTTSIGMHPDTDGMPVEADALPLLAAEGAIVSDLIYNPAETRLLALAKQIGAVVHGGLGMFVYQGAYAFEYWTGRPAPVEVMRETVEREMRKAGTSGT